MSLSRFFKKIKLLFVKSTHDWSPWGYRASSCIQARKCSITHKTETRIRHLYKDVEVIEEDICPVCAGAGVEYDGDICIGCGGACLIEATNHYTSDICSRCGK